MKIEDILLEDYQIRKNKAQKTAFIDFVMQLCAQKNLSVTVQKKGSTRNIIIGDVNAPVIFGAHYDTCANMVVPNFITPKKPVLYLAYSFLLGLFVVAAAVLCAMAATELISPAWYMPVYLTVLLGSIIMMIAGPANSHTANDNTSGTAAVLRLALELPEDLRNKACFVLFDQEELGLIGSSVFASQHKTAAKQAVMINFDCVGDGDVLLYAPQKRLRKTMEYETLCVISQQVCDAMGKEFLPCKKGGVMYPSDQMNFKKGVGVAFLRRNRFFGYYMNRIHTKRDTVLQKENLEVLQVISQKYLEQL